MKKIIYHIIAINLIQLILFTYSAYSYDFPHFYRTAYFPGEPRLQKNKLTSINITMAGGSTHEARNNDGDTICLLDLYGPSNIPKLGAGIANKDPNDPADLALIYLDRIPTQDGFGFLSYSGTFSLFEILFSFTQNIKNGFFIQLLAPLSYMELNNTCFRDLSSTDNSCPNQKHPYWQLTLNQLNNILYKYNLYSYNWKNTNFGDTTALVGVTHNYQETTILDYIDFTFKTGILFPSGRERSLYRIFDIPSGYDGHIGIPLQIDSSFGAFDWLTIGAHSTVLSFLSKTKMVRMKTAYNQCGPIKLAKGCALIKKGTIFDIGAYLKADHFAHGFSLLIGYSYNKKYKDELTPKNVCLFDTAIVNSDSMLHEWDMHTLHILAEYDFARDNTCFCPRIALFYNWQIDGRNVLKNSIAGGTFGFNIVWEY